MIHVKWIIKSIYCNFGFLSTFYQLVEFDHDQKPYDWKAHSRLSEKMYWVCSYSTIKVGLYPFPIVFIQDYFFKMGFTGWSSFWPRSKPIWLKRQWSIKYEPISISPISDHKRAVKWYLYELLGPAVRRSLLPPLKISTKSTVRGSLHPPFKKSDRIGGPWIP